MKSKVYFILFACLLFINSMYGQDVVAIAKVDTNKVVLGAPIQLEISIAHPKDVDIAFPYISDSVGQIEVIKILPVDTMPIENPNQLLRIQRITLMPFDSGKFLIPAYQFKYSRRGQTFELSTAVIPIEVFTVPIDTTKSIRAIHDIIAVPYDWKFIVMVFLIAIAIGLISYFLWRKWKSRKKVVKEEMPELVALPAHEIALLALSELNDKQLWQKDLLKQYYTELTDILRIYIHQRWGVNAMEMTSDEIASSFVIKSLNAAVNEKLIAVLRLSDIVKFAKGSALPSDNTTSLQHAIDFVVSTKVVEEIANEGGKSNG